jgi:SAM-dependent methyltransferase
MDPRDFFCRVCHGDLLMPPLLSYPDSPSSAQGFLDEPPEPGDSVCLDIYQCLACGLVQHPLEVVPYYKEVIRAIAFSDEMARFRHVQLGEWIASKRLESSRILEVGCGRGEYMELMQRSGACNVIGIEYSSKCVEYALGLGLDVRPGYLDESLDTSALGKFDAFAIFSFMEHWPDPNGSLRCLNKLLKEGACGLVEVPNFEFILKNGLYSEFTTDHIFYFDRSTLTRVLEINGFEVQEIQSIWHDYILSARIIKRARLDASGFILRQQEVVGQVQAFVNNFAAKEVVVWGAGHQALAVTSLAQLGDKVSHVVDSATFKQGLYTPGSGLLIKSPSSLSEDQPRSIVVMAAAYSDEVLREIYAKYPFVQSVAVLRETHLEVFNVELRKAN